MASNHFFFKKKISLHPISVDCINMNKNQQNVLQFTSSQEGANSLKFNRKERCPSHLGSLIAEND